MPRVVGPVSRKHPVQVRDVEFLRAHTSRPIKITVPGPFTMSQQAQNDHYGDPARAGAGLRRRRCTTRSSTSSPPARTSCRSTSRTCRRAPTPAARSASPRSPARSTAFAGTTALHICFGYAAIIHERPEAYSFLPELAAATSTRSRSRPRSRTSTPSILRTLPGKRIILGVLDLDDPTVESAETVADRIRRALPYKAATELVAAPDCGMKYLPRDVAYGKLEALVAGAAQVRSEA